MITSQDAREVFRGSNQAVDGTVYYWRTYSDGYCRFYKDEAYQVEKYRAKKIDDRQVKFIYPEQQSFVFDTFSRKVMQRQVDLSETRLNSTPYELSEEDKQLIDHLICFYSRSC